MRSKFIGVASLFLALSACGGGKDPLAQLCVDETAKRLEGQVYRLDEKALVANKAQSADGNTVYTGEITMKPGTSGESKQTLECTVAPASGDTPARIIGFRFNMAGSGLTG